MWMEAEDPFQFLGACFELRKALRAPRHEEYASHLPVHQDGSCNGLQHYAALARDEQGGIAVNLVPGVSARQGSRLLARARGVERSVARCLILSGSLP